MGDNIIQIELRIHEIFRTKFCAESTIFALPEHSNNSYTNKSCINQLEVRHLIESFFLVINCIKVPKI